MAAWAYSALAHFGLAPYLSGVYGGELDGRFDDKGELIAHLLKREGIDASQAVMIGDRANDTEAAMRNGVRSIGVLWGYGGTEELLSGGATRLCATPDALSSCVASVLAGT